MNLKIVVLRILLPVIIDMLLLVAAAYIRELANRIEGR